jgi:thiol-disulfide isomerase/thioredoxin
VKSIALVLSVVYLSGLAAFAEPPISDQVLAKAKAKASAEKKTIFLHFGASWCGWCKRLDAFLDRPDIKPVFEKYFVPVKLVVQENDKNKALENPGADTLLNKLGGPSGLPYSAFLDAQGAFIVNSKRPSALVPEGENIGYPGQPNEIDWFIQMMRKAAPNMSVDDLKTIETALRAFKRT